MDSLVLLIFFATVIYALNRGFKAPKKAEPCDLHKWDYIGEEGQRYMQCTVCGLLPDTDIKWSLDKEKR